MKHKMDEQSFDSIIDSFDPCSYGEANRQRGREFERPITFWVPIPLKKQYESLQRNSKAEFGRVLKKAVSAAIERTAAKVPEKAGLKDKAG